MPKYRRRHVPGGTYFFTLCLAEPGETLLVDEIGLLRASFAEALRRRPARIDAAVILPDHLHMIWTLPDGDADFPTRIGQIKGRFTHVVGLTGARSRSQARKGEWQIWQRRYWEHLIRGPADLARHLAYCWYDPVRHGFARYPGEWSYSSFHRELRRGRVPHDWERHLAFGDYGERPPGLVSASAAA